MKNFIFVSIAFWFVGCKQSNTENYDVIKKQDDTKTVADAIPEGKKLLETHCYLCHSPTAAEQEGRIAPPMIAVKSRYLMDYETKEDFVNAIVAFTEKPSPDKALMHGAVKRFGVMPQQVFPKDAVSKIADFMFTYQIDAPEWFKEHWEGHGNEDWQQPGKKLTTTSKVETVAEIGLSYALSTKKELGKNLMSAIQKDGTLAALEFCNVEAMPLTTKMSEKHQANIKRVSNKNRNPNNQANQEELGYISAFEKALATNQEMEPIVVENGKDVHFYYPIITNSMCLQCHGKSNDISPEVKAKILKLYPNDLAIGYAENQIRGIWSITFEK